MPDPRKATPEETAGALLRSALLAFAAREDLYIPRQLELAEFLMGRVVEPLLADLRSDPGWLTGSTVVDGCGTAMYCPDQDEHGTHIWDWQLGDPVGSIVMRVRCPGRDGI